MKTYKRTLEGMNSIQKLIVTDDNKFHRIENCPLGPHITRGFCPNEFKTGHDIPRGFYAKYGFKKHYESDLGKEFQDYSEGNFTGNF
jgi:hypothetical protein